MNLEARIAIEALRAGVPNRTAIRRMGNEHTLIEVDFERALEAAWQPNAAPGFGFAGGFGTGKSHLLGYLAEVARGQRAIVSRVAISKETPLANPTAVFAAAVRNAVLPDGPDDALGACLAQLRAHPDRAQALEDAVSAPEAGFAPIFAAVPFLLRRSASPPELLRGIERMLGGSRIPTPAVRAALRAAGARGTFPLTRIDPRQLAAQRIAFLPMLFRAAGYGPWCLLLDEVELIGRYTPLQRALAYAQLAGWLGFGAARRPAGLVALFAITDDFVEAVINPKLDSERLPERLRLKGRDDEAALAAAGIAAIERSVRTHRLAAPEAHDLVACHDKLRVLYTEAYDWPAPDLPPAIRTSSRTMRHYIKSWVTQWDLARLLGRRDALVTETLTTNYAEDASLDAAPPEGEEAE
ncbi:MAG: DUF2791 family P-loop domain-containing protein [Rhodospirillales bacterium]|jgi:hypothetical protein|nr:DUF2791 family P-loop domain-containing protein [Rhodospirillales bacterium]